MISSISGSRRICISGSFALKKLLTFEKHSSMGIISGEYGGKNMGIAPISSIRAVAL